MAYGSHGKGSGWGDSPHGNPHGLGIGMDAHGGIAQRFGPQAQPPRQQPPIPASQEPRFIPVDHDPFQEQDSRWTAEDLNMQDIVWDDENQARSSSQASAPVSAQDIEWDDEQDSRSRGKHPSLVQGEQPGLLGRIKEFLVRPDTEASGAKAVVELAAKEAGMSPEEFVDHRLGALDADQNFPGTVYESAGRDHSSKMGEEGNKVRGVIKKQDITWEEQAGPKYVPVDHDPFEGEKPQGFGERLKSGIADAARFTYRYGIQQQPLYQRYTDAAQTAREVVDPSTKPSHQGQWADDPQVQLKRESARTGKPSLVRALSRGFYQASPGMVGGFGAWAGSSVSRIPGLEKPGEYVRDKGMSLYDASMRRAYENPATVEGLAGIKEREGALGKIGATGTWALESIVEFIPQMVNMAVGAKVLGPVIGSAARTGPQKKVVDNIIKVGANKHAAKLKKAGVPAAQAERMAQGAAQKAFEFRTGAAAQVTGMYTGSNYAEVMHQLGVDNPVSALATGLGAGALTYLGGQTALIESVLGRNVRAKITEAINTGNTSMAGHIVREFAKIAPKAALEEFSQESLALFNNLVNDPELENTAGSLIEAYMENIERPLESAATVAVAAGVPGAGVRGAAIKYQGKSEQGGILDLPNDPKAFEYKTRQNEPSKPSQVVIDFFSNEPRSPAGFFAGVKAETADTQTLEQAKKMKSQGASLDEIWKKTGWAEIIPGQWSFEIDSQNVRLKSQFENKDSFKDVFETAKKPGKVLTLKDILDAPDLYEAYPSSKNIEVKTTKRDDAAFNFSPFLSKPRIYLGRELPVDYIKTALVHEIQHYIQEVEGTARGTSPAMIDINPEMAHYHDLFRWHEFRKKRDLKDLLTYHKYALHAGEAEARLAQRRSIDNVEWLHKEPPWKEMEEMLKDEQLLRDDQVKKGVTYNDILAFSDRDSVNVARASLVYDIEKALPPEIIKSIQDDGVEKECFAVEDNGQIHIIDENIPTSREADYTFLNVLARQKGLDSLLESAFGGKSKKQQFMTRTASSFNKEIRDQLDLYGLKPTIANKRMIAEEVILFQAWNRLDSDQEEDKQLDQLLKKLEKWTQKIVPGFQPTRSELKRILLDSDPASRSPYIAKAG